MPIWIVELPDDLPQKIHCLGNNLAINIINELTNCKLDIYALVENI